MELKTINLKKEYKVKIAVKDVSLTLTSGVCGLLGANGAGKTTLMRMVAGIIEISLVIYPKISGSILNLQFWNTCGI